MNLPNKLTLSRILIIPIFMIFVIPFPDWLFEGGLLQFANPQLLSINRFISRYGNYIAAVIFVIASSTDAVDGYIARKRKLVTQLGKFLDPIADKLLVTAALIALVQRNELTGWVAMVIIFREFIVTGLRLVAAGEGIIIAASNWGKIKTLTQIIAIVATLTRNYPLSLIINGFSFDTYAMIIAVVVTIYSGYDYIVKNINVIKANE